MKEPIVSIIIPVYNGEKTLRECLDSILDQTYKNYEIILVDNNSRDKTKDIINEYLKKNKNIIHLFEKIKILGSARNTGEKIAKGKIIVMTDCDCIVTKDWIEQIIKPILNNECDAVQGFEESPINNFWSRNIQKQSENKIKALPKTKDTIGLIDTKNLAISHEVLKNIGLTNRKYMSGNDTSLSIMFHKQGYRLKFIPEIKVKHYHADSFKKLVKKYIIRGKWSAIICKDYKDYLINTNFLEQTNQTFWTFFKFFPGLLKTLITQGPSYTLFDLVSGVSWRIGLVYGWLTYKKEDKL